MGAPEGLLVVGLLLIVSVATARCARSVGLPAMTGHLLAGLLVGVIAADLVRESVALLATAKQGAASLLLFWIGSRLRVKGGRRQVRSASTLASAAALSVLFCTLALALPLPPAFAPVTDVRGFMDLFVVALVLSVASPTVMAVVAQEQGSRSRLARTGLDATVLTNTVLLVLILVTLAFGSDARETSLAFIRDLCAGLAVGAAIGVVVGRGDSHVPRSLLVALAAISFLVLRNELQHYEAAIMAGSFLAGASMAHVGHEPALEKRLLNLGGAVPTLSAVLFAVAGALTEVRMLADMAVPAALIVMVRGASLWAGSRLAGTLAGDTSIRRLGFATLLPQAGFSLAIVGALGTAGDPMVTLVLAVVLINELAMPPLLRAALRAGATDAHGVASARRV